jgi:hypothetical protein
MTTRVTCKRVASYLELHSEDTEVMVGSFLQEEAVGKACRERGRVRHLTVLRNLDCLRHEVEEATLLAVVPGLQDEICVRMLVCATEVRASVGGIDVRVLTEGGEGEPDGMRYLLTVPRATV